METEEPELFDFGNKQSRAKDRLGTVVQKRAWIFEGLCGNPGEEQTSMIDVVEQLTENDFSGEVPLETIAPSRDITI